jgi:hypothetical protein
MRQVSLFIFITLLTIGSATARCLPKIANIKDKIGINSIRCEDTKSKQLCKLKNFCYWDANGF